MTNTIYPFRVQQFNGEEISLEAYRNKVLLIVNTASQCGLTPQLDGLRQLKESFDGADFEILAFPSNDFAGQEPLQGGELAAFCDAKAPNYKVFDKVHVKGTDAHPLFKFLASKQQNGFSNVKPLWNFHKFLIGANGAFVDHFYPFTKPTATRLRKKIAAQLSLIDKLI